MHRIDTPNKAVDLFGAGKPGWRDGNKAAGINPTEFNAAMMNTIQEEIAGIIEFAGLALDSANNAQMLLAIEKLIEARSGNYALDTGVANAYVIALSPAIAAYAGNFSGSFKAVNANTGASTLNAGGGVVNLVNDAGGALAAVDIAANSIVSYNYIAADNKFYVTSIVQSQADARYLQLSNVATSASDPTYADNSTKGASTGWVRGAMSAIATAAGFAASFTGNGYIKLPSWLGSFMIQWGGATCSGGTVAVTYPIAFPTSLFAYGYFNNSTSSSGTTTSATGGSLTGFNAASSYVSMSGYWIALGK